MKSKGFEGVWIPKDVFIANDMTLHQKIIYSIVSNLSSDAPCYASNHYIADLIGISHNRVSVHLNNLRKMDYIKIKIERNNKNAHITKRRIRVTEKLKHVVGQHELEAESRFWQAQQVGNDVEPLVETDLSIIKNNNKEYNKDNISSSKSLIKDMENESFLKFWKTIPALRRVNKQRTKKNWILATHKESAETIQKAMELFVERVEPMYIKTSYAWLSEERWNSIPPEPPKTRGAQEYR